MTGAHGGTSLGEVWKIGSDRDCKAIIEESFSCLILENRIQGHLRVEEEGRRRTAGAYVCESCAVTASLSLRDSAEVTMKTRDSQPWCVVLTEGTLLLAFTSFSFDEV